MKIVALLFPLVMIAAPAAAQEAEESPADYDAGDGGSGFELDGELIFLSDYRFRGISRSDEDPAGQARLTLSTPNGLYAGVRATTLKGFAHHGSAELDLYAGYGAELSLGTSLDAGLLYYYFPGGDGSTDYFEPYASLSHTLGPVEATLGAKYAWEQAALGGEDLLYLFGQVDAGIPATPVTLSAQLGRQDAGAFGDYWNWSLGALYAFGPLEAGLRYVDTDLPALPGQDAGLLLSLGFRF